VRVGLPGAARPAAAPPVVVFDTPIPSDLLPPLPAYVVADSAGEGDGVFDEKIWDDVPDAGREMPGDAVIDDQAAWLAEANQQAAGDGDSVVALPPGDGSGDFDGGWATVRDANIRPYVDWRPAQSVSLPMMTTPRPQQQPAGGGHHNNHRPQNAQGNNSRGNNSGGGNGNNSGGAPGNSGGRNRRRRRGRDRQGREGGGTSDRNRDRGPRLPGFYNPGGD
jgi:hypothetical protein